MRTKLTFLAVALALAGCAPKSTVPAYLDPQKPIEERVEDALGRMTLEEKVAMVHAQSKFTSPGVPRLGIPEVLCSDAGNGMRPEMMWNDWFPAGHTNDSCIAFPSFVGMAATWNREMAALCGKSVGEEARYRGKTILLGPAVNIFRTPLNGRNLEYLGEDPLLAGQLAASYVQAVQKNGVAACVKHFAVNNQETDRLTIDVELSDRALHEIYLPAFRAAVGQGGVWSVMGAYNRYKGEHCCHNQYLNKILKSDWAFDGVFLSDWGGTHDTRQSVFNGLDIEFSSKTDWRAEGYANEFDSYYLAMPYMEMLRKGEGVKELDDKVRRILRLILRTTMSSDRPWGSFGTEEHALASRRVAEESMVLLRTEGGLLPLDPAGMKRILVVGENAVRPMNIGGGSSDLKVKYEVSLLDGVRNRAPQGVQVDYLPGYASPALLPSLGSYYEVDPRAKVDTEGLRAAAVAAAAQADAVVFVGGLNRNRGNDSEENDRAGLELPYGQDELIRALVQANPRTVVALVSGNAVAMPWVGEVPAILQAWYCGTEGGNAFAAILFGDVNPSGKLPFTFPRKVTDIGAHAGGPLRYPGVDGRVVYEEDIFVGYRWLDKYDIEALFPFGHGLSYTTFACGPVTADRDAMSASGKLAVSVPVKNTGDRAGAEVVQLYISDLQSTLPRPVKELKDFAKVILGPGEEKVVTFTIGKDALSYYDDGKSAWVAEPGTFEVLIGASSADIRGKVAFELK